MCFFTECDLILRSPVANYGLWVKEGQGTAKQWWALQQQPHICESMTWVMIHIDQLQVENTGTQTCCTSVVILAPFITGDK
jgi:hypothetical protein